MKLKKVAKNAALEVSESISTKLSKKELEEVTGIIAKAMEQAVNKATNHSLNFCIEHLNPDTDKAHQIRKDIKRKQDTLITNLSSLR